MKLAITTSKYVILFIKIKKEKRKKRKPTSMSYHEGWAKNLGLENNT